MKITWHGAASILIEAAGERILFDPFVQLRGAENPNSLDDFIEERYICITHGHLDHLMEAAEFLDRETPGEATVYCGSVPADTLMEQGVDCSNVVLVEPGMQWKIGNVGLKVYKARHSVPEFFLKIKTLLHPRMIKYAVNTLFLASANRQFPEGNETFMYEIRAEGKRVQILGSMGLDELEEYETGAELLILPFQGVGRPEEEAEKIIERLKPKHVLLDHFDDAFPPVSRTVDTRRFKKLMDEKYPHIQVVKPTAGHTVTF